MLEILNNKFNNIISIEAYYLNYARLLSNLKINNIFPTNTFLASFLTNRIGKFEVSIIDFIIPK